MKKILIDCDPGMDDSVAILAACKSQEVQLLAVTAVNGNYPVDVTAGNARKTLELAGRTDIPVGRGMSRPIARPSPKDPFTHGADGQAEANLPKPSMPLSEKHGVDLLIDTVKANAGDITLVMTGPMTNLAMALLKAPEIAPMINGIIAITGMFGLNEAAFKNATGDTPQSEWNVYVDPEAADTVYRAGIPLVALGLDVATHFDVNFTDADLARLAKSDKPEAAFLLNAIRFVNGRGFDAYCAVIDCMAVAVAIDPTLVECFAGRVGVETKNGLTLGMTVLDRRHHYAWDDLPLVNVAQKADCGRFLKMLMDLILA